MDFSTIVAATNNFSDANELGQGGFGPVYKVNITVTKKMYITSTKCGIADIGWLPRLSFIKFEFSGYALQWKGSCSQKVV